MFVSVIVWIRRWLFWTSVFFFGSCAPSEKYLGPKQSPPISHNDLKKDGAQLLLSNSKLLDDNSNQHQPQEEHLI